MQVVISDDYVTLCCNSDPLAGDMLAMKLRLDRTLADVLDIRHNGLNLIRLILATAVIVYHTAPVGGFGLYLTVGDMSLGHLAVAGFFAISGYLITRSRMGTRIGRYAWQRLLRIMPGYWGCLIVTGFVLSAIASLRVGGWSPSDGLRYVLGNASMLSFHKTIGATLAGQPFSADWNGSLWTLRYELICYLLIAAVMTIPLVRRRPSAVLVGFVALGVFHLASGAAIPGQVADLILLVLFFSAGALLYLFAERVPVDAWVAAAAVVLFVGAAYIGMEALAAVPMAYLCLWAGAAMPARLCKIGARNDVSYGMYLYGFPVQQTLVVFGAAALGQLGFAVASIAATLPFALASWFLVERPAKRLNRIRADISRFWGSPAEVVLPAMSPETSQAPPSMRENQGGNR